MAIETATHALLAFRRGKVAAICVVGDDDILRQSVVDWALDAEVSEIIRVPLHIARRSFEATPDEVRAWLTEETA